MNSYPIEFISESNNPDAPSINVHRFSYKEWNDLRNIFKRFEDFEDKEASRIDDQWNKALALMEETIIDE